MISIKNVVESLKAYFFLYMWMLKYKQTTLT